MIKPCDQEISVLEWIATQGLLDVLPREYGETQSELLKKLILPLVHKAARGDDEDADGVRPHNQFADVESGHDRLACAGVVGKHKP